MKKLLFLLLFLPFFSFAQDCKFEILKDPKTNQDIKSINVRVNNAKCLVRKIDSTVSIFYRTSVFMAVLTANTNDVSIDLDSAKLIFDNITIKTNIQGTAECQNKQVLKPILDNPSFTITVTPTILNYFRNSKSLFIKLYGERGVTGAVPISDKEFGRIKTALGCI